MRLMAATSSYLSLNPDDDFFRIRQYLYEQGSLLNDLIDLRKTQVVAFASAQQVQQANNALKQLIEQLFPERSEHEKAESERIAALMKELEETIVVIDRKTIDNHKKAERKKKLIWG
jgi:hypothetical protein